VLNKRCHRHKTQIIIEIIPKRCSIWYIIVQKLFIIKSCVYNIFDSLSPHYKLYYMWKLTFIGIPFSVINAETFCFEFLFLRTSLSVWYPTIKLSISKSGYFNCTKPRSTDESVYKRELRNLRQSREVA